MSINKKSKPIDNIITIYLVILTVIFTFYYRIENIDKYVGFFIFITAIFLIISKKNNLHFIYRNSLNKYCFFIGVMAATVVYFVQLIKFGKVINIEVFTILSIYATLIFYNSTKDKFNYLNFIKIYGFIMFLFIIINYLTTEQPLITSIRSFIVYLCFVVFYLFYTSNKLLLITSSFMVLIMQSRIIILSLFVVLGRSEILGRNNLIKGFISIFIILVILYNFFPESRIFQLHTSGRLVHWESIIYSFDLNNIWIGMGSGSSKEMIGQIGNIESYGRVHNEFITYFYELGLFGLLSLVLVLKLIHSSSSNKGRVVFYTIILQMFTDIIFTYYFNYLLPIILCILIDYDMKLKEARSENTKEKVIKLI